MGVLDQADWGWFFQRSETWKAFGVAVVLFGVIAFAGLSLFDSMDEIFESDAEPAPIPGNRYSKSESKRNRRETIPIQMRKFVSLRCEGCHHP